MNCWYRSKLLVSLRNKKLNLKETICRYLSLTRFPNFVHVNPSNLLPWLYRKVHKQTFFGTREIFRQELAMTLDAQALDSNVHVVFNDEDLPFEEELLRNPHSLKAWQRYIEAKQGAPKKQINIIYERALKELPGSYKLWYNYLVLRRKQVKNRCITDPAFDEINNAFERALVFMHKMPRIWMDYCQFLVDQKKITRTRRVFDRALRALPITQHDRIWPLYIKFVKSHAIPETAVRVFRRYLQLCPENTEDFIAYLVDIDRLDDAAQYLAKIVNNQDFISKEGKSNHALWYELCELISKNPHKVQSLNVDAIIRGGLRRYTDQIGHLWNSLADYYIRSGLFERARDIYEEAIQTVTTVRDFTQIFDAYAQFEELALSKRMEDLQVRTYIFRSFRCKAEQRTN